jgi:Sister chromatid cohesion protein Dcc1
VYKVDVSFLRGLAIAVGVEDGESTTEGERCWKYLAADQLPPEPTAYFVALFDAKSAWVLRDLQPYLDHLVDDTGIPQADLLLRFTKFTTMEENGEPVKYFVKR